MKARLFSLFLLFLLFPLAAQESENIQEVASLDVLLQEAQEAIQKEYYQQALELLDQAAWDYPDSYEVPLLKGDLYNQKKLYNLALETFSEADRLNPGDYDILYRMATVLGRLNRNHESVKVLEALKEAFPESLDTVADLGWMYFKTFRFKEGEALLLEALDTFGGKPGLLMTLGTVYTGLYDYEKGVEYYQRSIDAALEGGWTDFAAVAYYNLSLLNKGHHHFQEAQDNTRLSLDLAARSTGYTSLGELSLARMDFPGSLEAFTMAYQKDDTPLSLVNLAEFYWHFGMLDEAEAHLDQARNWKNDSWMYSFGIDPDRYLRDLHFLYGRIYRSQAHSRVRTPARGWGILKNWIYAGLYRLKGWYHRRLFRSLNWRIGEDFEKAGHPFDADISHYNALEEYPLLAGEILRRAKDFEVSMIPESEPSYLFEEGRLRKDLPLLLLALEKLDPLWEAQAREEVLATLIPLEGGPAQQARDSLYGMNPGAFLREGLVFSVVWEGPEDRGLQNQLRRGGLNLLDPNEAGGARYRLVVETGEGAPRVLLKEDRTGDLLWVEVLEAEESAEEFQSDLVLANGILATLFRVRG